MKIKLKKFSSPVAGLAVLVVFLQTTTPPSFAQSPVERELENKARGRAFYGEVFKASAKVLTPLAIVVGVKGILKHTAKDFRKGWQMARTGVIQSHLGDRLAYGSTSDYRRQTGFRKVATSARYFASGLSRLILPHSLVYHTVKSAWKTLKAGNDMLRYGYSTRQRTLEARAQALAKGYHKRYYHEKGRQVVDLVPPEPYVAVRSLDQAVSWRRQRQILAAGLQSSAPRTAAVVR